MGGIGFKRLAVWNRALISKHIWDLAYPKSSLWVSWVRHHYLQDTNLWVVHPTSKWSWVQRKIMQLRTQVRSFIKTLIGNGLSVNAWEDTWLNCGPLSSFVSYRFIHGQGFSVGTTVQQLINSLQDGFCGEWLVRYPQLSGISLPSLCVTTSDRIWWVPRDHSKAEFSVSIAYASFDDVHTPIPWNSAVWFKGNIPKHSFCMWVACLKRLPTQDRLSLWKDNPPDYKCSLCLSCMDSHSHLFFECNYSKEVWGGVTRELDWDGFPSSWDDIVEAISTVDSMPRQLVHKLALAASVYFVWQERNTRIFSDEKRPTIVLIKEILALIRLRSDWECRMKKVDL